MRTNIVLDPDLVAEAAALTGIQTKRELVDQALRALIAAHRRRPLNDLYGQIDFAEDYDHRALRSERP